MWVIYFNCDTPEQGVAVKNEEEAMELCAWDSNLKCAYVAQ